MSFRFRQQDQAIQFGRVDQMMFNKLAEEAPIVEETINDLSRDPYDDKPDYLNRSHVEAIQFDTYNALFKNTPKRSDAPNPLIGEVIDRMQQTERYPELRSYTVGQDLPSALGACGLVREVITHLPKDVQDAANNDRKKQEEANEAQAELEAHQDEDGKPDPDVDFAEYQEFASFAKHKAEQADKARKQLVKAIQSHGKAIAQVVASGVSKAAEHAGAMSAACNAFGLNDSSVSDGLPIEAKFKIAELLRKNGKQFRKLIELIGRLKQTAERKHAEKMHHEGGEIVDITQGNDPGLLLDEEVALLRNPVLGLLKRAALVDESLSQFEVESRETQAKGDIIALVDESGSMSGDRDKQAKALVLALAHIAMKQKRKLRVLFFQTSITARFDLDGTSSAIDMAMRNLGSIASRGTGGGTNFDGPLREALESTDDLRNPDLLVLTDGHATISQETSESIASRKSGQGLNVYTVLIGGASSSHGQVEKFSDRVWSCDDLLNEAAPEILGSII